MRPVSGWLEGAVQRVRAFARARPRCRLDRHRPKVGLALGGGFARGISHIGVLRVFEENGLPVDCIAGTSVGSLIASAYAAGSSLEEMERQAAVTHFRDFGRWTLSWMGLATNERLEHYLHRFSPAARFEELKLPLAVAATDLGTGEAVYFTEGEIGPPLRASCAYPGLFLPVEHRGRILVDGFLAAPVPVEAVRQLGADVVIGVYLDSTRNADKPDSLMDVIGRSFSIMQRHAHRDWRYRADVVLEPDVASFDWDDFEQTPGLIAAGEAAARAALPQIREAIYPSDIESVLPRPA